MAVVGVKVARPGETDVSLFFDEKTGLLKKIEYKTGAVGDKGVLFATVLDDYRAIEMGAVDLKVLKEANVGSDGPALLTFLRSQIHAEADRKAIYELLKQLADETFEVREKATTQLIALGSVAVPFLREASKDDDAEVARRAKHCLDTIGQCAPRRQRLGPGACVGWLPTTGMLRRFCWPWGPRARNRSPKPRRTNCTVLEAVAAVGGCA